LKRMITLEPRGTTFLPTTLIPLLSAMIAGHALGTLLVSASRGDAQAKDRVARLFRPFGCALESDPISGAYPRFTIATVSGAFVVFTWVLVIFFFAPTNTSPFIYFQF